MTTLAFTEEMKGHVAFDVADPRAGERVGTERDQKLMFHLTITVDDVGVFLDGTAHRARAEGWVEADVLGGRRPVGDGWFTLFSPGADAGERLMTYGLHITDGGDNPVTLLGHKEVRDDRGLDVWSDTTTLFFTLHTGHVDEAGAGAPVAAGVLHILGQDFLRQLTTLSTSGSGGVAAMADFGRFFLSQLWGVYVEGKPVGAP